MQILLQLNCHFLQFFSLSTPFSGLKLSICVKAEKKINVYQSTMRSVLSGIDHLYEYCAWVITYPMAFCDSKFTEPFLFGPSAGRLSEHNLFIHAYLLFGFCLCSICHFGFPFGAYGSSNAFKRNAHTHSHTNWILSLKRHWLHIDLITIFFPRPRLHTQRFACAHSFATHAVSSEDFSRNRLFHVPHSLFSNGSVCVCESIKRNFRMMTERNTYIFALFYCPWP